MHFGQKYHLTKKNGILAHFIGIKNVLKKYEKQKANKTHYNIGKNIREVIKKNGGTMPENLPKPDKSLKELEKNKHLID